MKEINYSILKSTIDPENVELPYASIFTRVTALITDITIATLLCIPLVNFFTNRWVQSVQEGHIVVPFYQHHFVFKIIGTLVAVWFVCAIFDCSPLRGSPGKWLAGCETINGFGKQIPFARAMGRQIIKFSLLPLFIFLPFIPLEMLIKLLIYTGAPIILINLYMILFNSEKQSLHDAISKTYVIDKKNRTLWMTMLVFLASLATFFFVSTWMKNHVLLDTMATIPKEIQATMINGLLRGESEISLRGEITHSTDSETKKLVQIASDQTFQYVTNTIYKDAFNQDIRQVLPQSNENVKMLNSKGPVYTTMEYMGSYQYEFTTYLPNVPNLVINPNAFTLAINTAYDHNGSMLTPSVDKATTIEEKKAGEIKFIVIKKKVSFAQMAPVEKIAGNVSFRLPTALESKSASLDQPVNSVDLGTQNFSINSMTDKVLEFTHNGSAEYFLGVVGYEKGNPYPLLGSLEILSDQPMRRMYKYEFNRSIERYEFNTSIYYYLEKFPFSSDTNN